MITHAKKAPCSGKRSHIRIIKLEPKPTVDRTRVTGLKQPICSPCGMFIFRNNNTKWTTKFASQGTQTQSRISKS
ncbi:unnamed protein product [Periconia digitata]|uniref:Uncharacterized protein n=1 Tax=Periconia digitata TaxID=1303443 RepID=A0A9W4UDT3_9PLEO|nr:unnamed protein product [Periconia digitata]